VQLKRDGVTQPRELALHKKKLTAGIYDQHYIGTEFVQTIKGEGMPRFEDPSVHGDLYVEYNVVLPTVLGNDQKRSEWKINCPWYGYLGLTSSLYRTGRCV
jgi:hypothetical protein